MVLSVIPKLFRTKKGVGDEENLACKSGNFKVEI